VDFFRFVDRVVDRLAQLADQSFQVFIQNSTSLCGAADTAPRA
jgi:hypothetical protein